MVHIKKKKNLKKKKNKKNYPPGDTDTGSRLLPCVWKFPWRRKWHSSFLAWRIPCTEEPGSPCGCKESDMTERLTLPPPASWRSFGKIPSSL